MKSRYIKQDIEETVFPTSSEIAFYTCGIVISTCIGLFSGTLSILIFELIGLGIIRIVSGHLDNETYARLLLIKCLGVAVVLLIYFGNIDLYGAPYYIGGSDDVTCERMAITFIQEGYNWPWDYTYASNLKGFYWLLSVLIKLVNKLGMDYHTLAYRILNIDLHIAISVLVFKICYIKENLSADHARIAMCIYGLFPNSLYISSFVFRDTVSLLLIIQCSVFAMDIIRPHEEYGKFILWKNKISASMALSVLWFFSYWIRSENVLYISLIVFVCFLCNTRRPKTGIVFGVIIMIVLSYWLLDKVGLLSKLTEKVTNYSEYRQELASETGLSKFIFSKPLFPVGIILRSAYGLVSPLPVDIMLLFKAFTNGELALEFLVALGICAQIAHMPITLSAILQFDRISLCFGIVFLSIVCSTFTFRHFIMIYPFMAIMIAKQYSSLNSLEYKKKLGIGIVGFFFIGVLYLIIKVVL